MILVKNQYKLCTFLEKSLNALRAFMCFTCTINQIHVIILNIFLVKINEKIMFYKFLVGFTGKNNAKNQNK